MDFSLTDEQREIQALAREFAQAEIEPNAAAWDREHRFPTELYPKLSELGLLGVTVPPLVRTVSSRTDGPSLNMALARCGALLALFSVLLSAGVLWS